MDRLRKASLWVVTVVACVGAQAQSPGDYIVAARRTGSIEFIEPITLKTVSRIVINIPSPSTGLNGIFADPDGRTIYFEGPIGPNSAGANNCCWLYSIDLATLRTKKVADIWGTRSRKAFVSTGPSLLQPVSLRAATATGRPDGDQWRASPDSRWWIGLRNGPAADLYDVARGSIVHSFAATNQDAPGWSSGTWLGNQFYIYAMHNGSGRLWKLSPQSTRLDDGIPVSDVGRAGGCFAEALMNIVASRDRLLVYEIFGGTIDRRNRCGNVRGGVSILVPTTGRFTSLIASTLYFTQLIPNRAGSEIYGLTSGAQGAQDEPQLVRIDLSSGKVLQSRSLAHDYWWLTAAPLRAVPSGDVALAADRNR